MRICQHRRTRRGKSEQTKLFSSASIPGLFSQTGTDWTASYLTGLSWFPTSRDVWQAWAWAANTITLPWKLFMKTLQPLLKDGVGVEHSMFVTRQLCQCFTVCHSAVVDLFPLCNWCKQPYHSFFLDDRGNPSLKSQLLPHNITYRSLWIIFMPPVLVF